MRSPSFALALFICACVHRAEAQETQENTERSVPDSPEPRAGAIVPSVRGMLAVPLGRLGYRVMHDEIRSGAALELGIGYRLRPSVMIGAGILGGRLSAPNNLYSKWDYIDRSSTTFRGTAFIEVAQPEGRLGLFARGAFGLRSLFVYDVLTAKDFWGRPVPDEQSHRSQLYLGPELAVETGLVLTVGRSRFEPSVELGAAKLLFGEHEGPEYLGIGLFVNGALRATFDFGP